MASRSILAIVLILGFLMGMASPIWAAEVRIVDGVNQRGVSTLIGALNH